MRWGCPSGESPAARVCSSEGDMGVGVRNGTCCGAGIIWGQEAGQCAGVVRSKSVCGGPAGASFMEAVNTANTFMIVSDADCLMD